MLQFLFNVVQQTYPDLNFQALLIQNIRKLILSPWTEQEIDLLTVDNRFVKPRTITVNYLKTIATLDNFLGTQVSKAIVKWFNSNPISSLEILSIY